MTLTKEEQKFFTDDNNYIEYFFEVGIRPNIFENDVITPDLNLESINSKLYPEIISKFPYFDKKSMTIDSTIIDFIFPKNFLAIQSTIKPNAEFYSIILDNPFYSSDFSYKYIGCLVIYESLNTYKFMHDSYSEDSNSKKDLKKSKDVFKNIYIPKCLCLASVHPNINKFESILRAIYDLFLKGKNYFIDDIIEKLICQTPKVPRGVKKIYLKICDKNIDLTETKLNELITVNVDLRTIFSSFKIEKIVEIYKFMLYETKMFVFSSKIGEITNFILSFTLLLKPFTYQYRILSILPKKFYYFLEDNNPCIFGVNELYSQNFFQENRLLLGTQPICIVDLDKKDYYVLNKNAKSFPTIPDHLKSKLGKRIEDYRKSKKKTGDKNEEYQEIFYRFMVNLLLDYPKFLKKNLNDSNILEDLFDKQGYINSQSNKEKDFYDKIISSKMFLDLIIKRMMPRDTKEKIQALFFEEKLNIKIASKKILRGNKILDQNVLLPSNDYSYVKDPEIIDLTGNNPYSILKSETLNFFNKENINKEICFRRGYKVREGNSKSELYFDYYLFPELLSENLFKYNCINYSVPGNYNFVIATINEDILKKCFIKFDDFSKGKSSEYSNDILISYLILFSLSLSYMDKEERKPRFNNLLQILSRIDNHDMEVIEMLFNSLIKLNEEELAVQLYAMFNQMHINLTWSIFLIMSKILHKGQTAYSSIIKDMKYTRGSSLKLANRHQNSRTGEIKFRKRSIKLPGQDDNILGEEIFFDVFGVCLNCKNSINLDKICKDLSPKELDKNNNRFKCKCGDWNVQKLNFKIGTELYNKNLTPNNSSLKEGVILYSPTNLKKKLLHILSTKNDKEFDFGKFRIEYPEEFWNSVWYFKLKEIDIDISFMLPYITPVCLNKYGNENNINNFVKFIMEDQRESRPFKMINNEIKNPNIKINKLNTLKIRFNNDILCIQKVYQISILKIIGMITYKPSDSYRGNISIKGNVVKGVYSKKKIQRNIENKNELRKGDSLLFSNNLMTSDFDLTTSTSAGNLDKSDEINNKIKEAYNNYENEIINRKTRVILPNDELFENIREDDENYYKFKEYKEDDAGNF